MNLEEFLIEFEAIAGNYKWRLTELGRIISDCGCPIETLAHAKSGKNYEFDLIGAINVLGFSPAAEITIPADYNEFYLTTRDLKTRRELLRITGLKKNA